MKLNLNAPFFQFINTAFDFVVLNICPLQKLIFIPLPGVLSGPVFCLPAASASVPCFFSACFSGFPLKACWH